MRQFRSRWNLIALASLLCAIQSVSSTAMADALQECVGRYELMIPGDADVALTIPTAFAKPQENPIRFSDDQPAVHSVFIYDGTFRITGSMSRADFGLTLSGIKTRVASRDENGRFEVIPTGRPDALAWAGNRAAGFYIYENGWAISFRESSSDPSVAKQRTQAVLKGFSARNADEIPKADGVCLPGMFVADNGNDSARKVGVTFRLKNHPDVTIFFLDEKALAADPKLTSKQKNEFVWGYEYGIGKRIKLVGAAPYRTVELDGREGVETSAIITRDDGSTDYGYLATVQGDFKAPVDTPNLLLLVERNAKYAKGNAPVTADELALIAKDIASSIKRRSTQ
ncbi:T6SS immunity protein Tli4 family protein [Burkholderia sp. Ap-962]|uniref:T6SS immunity protein Tli4 family protein n=1 Tax=Burkholderia sp. Ap-962 TaxID=2608333 RepID=UPI0014230B38|nr:T6SS immunity protein Tli4 family protein [Burkholderia sp. Ap-962]